MKIPVNVALEGETKFGHKGIIDLVDNRINPRTGTIEVRGVLPNANRLMDDGMRADGSGCLPRTPKRLC